MKKIDLNAAVWKEGKHYVSQCLNVDIASFGDSKKDALANLQQAVELYLEDTKNPNLVKVERPDVVSFKPCYA